MAKNIKNWLQFKLINGLKMAKTKYFDFYEEIEKPPQENQFFNYKNS